MQRATDFFGTQWDLIVFTLLYETLTSQSITFISRLNTLDYTKL